MDFFSVGISDDWIRDDLGEPGTEICFSYPKTIDRSIISYGKWMKMDRI